MKTRLAATLATACLALTLGACHQDQKTASAKEPAGMVATSTPTCPISGRAAKGNITSSYNGKDVHFCCPGCKARFDAMSDADKSKTLAGK